MRETFYHGPRGQVHRQFQSAPDKMAFAGRDYEGRWPGSLQVMWAFRQLHKTACGAGCTWLKARGEWEAPAGGEADSGCEGFTPAAIDPAHIDLNPNLDFGFPPCQRFAVGKDQQ